MSASSENAEPVCVALTADPAWERPLAALAASLSYHHADTGVRILALHTGMPEEAISKIGRAVAAPSRLEWLHLDESVLEDAAPAPHLPRSSLHVLALGEVLPPSVERVVYLDTDTLVTAPLVDLWRMDLDGAAVAAVRSAYMPWMGVVELLPWRKLGVAADDPYFNNGVVLFDLERWRALGVRTGALALMERFPLHFAEQDAMNVVLRGRWKELDPRWNLQTGHFAKPGIGYVAHGAERLDAAFADPAIVHFNGARKPWHPDDDHPWRDRWFDWLDRTPYRGWRPQASEPATPSRAAALRRIVGVVPRRG